MGRNAHHLTVLSPPRSVQRVSIRCPRGVSRSTTCGKGALDGGSGVVLREGVDLHRWARTGQAPARWWRSWSLQRLLRAACRRCAGRRTDSGFRRNCCSRPCAHPPPAAHHILRRVLMGAEPCPGHPRTGEPEVEFRRFRSVHTTSWRPATPGTRPSQRSCHMSSRPRRLMWCRHHDVGADEVAGRPTCGRRSRGGDHHQTRCQGRARRPMVLFFAEAPHVKRESPLGRSRSPEPGAQGR